MVLLSCNYYMRDCAFGRSATKSQSARTSKNRRVAAQQEAKARELSPFLLTRRRATELGIARRGAPQN